MRVPPPFSRVAPGLFFNLISTRCGKGNLTMDYLELEKRFTYHPPKDDQAVRYEKIRAAALGFAIFLNSMCPDSREKSIVMTKLDELVMFANASIARNE